MGENVSTPPERLIPYGRYELQEQIGTGGMAEVFRARLPGVAGFEKQVVIKRLQSKFRNDERFKRMFVEEAKLASQVQHKNVVQVFELGHHDGELYMVLEYVPGTDLKKLFREASLKRLSLPIWFSLHIAIEALEALAFAHDLKTSDGRRRNLVHCDVTPENIFLSTGGEVKLGDFGVAHDDTRAEDEFPGEIRGKLAYMAPEQLSGRAVDQRADVFSVGVVLWEALTQRRLFRSKSEEETVSRICHGDRARPSLYNGGVPPELDEAILAALRADRTRRTRTARELQRSLLQVQQTLGHRVALVDVERALRKILSAPAPSVDTGKQDDPTKIPTVETEIPRDPGFESTPRWETVPPHSSSGLSLPRPHGRGADTASSAWLSEAQGNERRPSPAAPTGWAVNSAAPDADTSRLALLDSMPPTPIRQPSRPGEPEAPPASLYAGWTAALSGSEPPRLPPQAPLQERTPPPRTTSRSGDPAFSASTIHTPSSVGAAALEDFIEPAPLVMAPIRGGTSQVETADILRWPRQPPATERESANPVKVVMGAPNLEGLGIWLRRPGSAETGPRPVPDALTVLRRLLLDTPALDAEVSVDGKTWRPGTLLARLLGEEVVPADGLLPTTDDRGSLDKTSLVALFGRLSRRQQSGRLIIVLDRPGRPERYELHVHRGRLFHVASTRSLFAAWRTLLSSPQVEQPQLRAWIKQVIEQTQPFELVAAAPVVEAVRAQQAHFAQEDLQRVFSEESGRYAFAAHPSPPSPNGSGHALLTLIPSLVSRACRTHDLEQRLRHRMTIPMVRSPNFETETRQLGLSVREASALDRFESRKPLADAVADGTDPRLRKLTLVLAYTLSELALLRPVYAVTP